MKHADKLIENNNSNIKMQMQASFSLLKMSYLSPLDVSYVKSQCEYRIRLCYRYKEGIMFKKVYA